jgi:hypothetical protein
MSRLPFEASIPKPCQQQWTAMSGSASARHCDSCQKTVHNFATLTPRQIERLVFENHGELCARVTRREDGSIVTATGFQSGIAAAALIASASITAVAHSQSTQPASAIVSGQVLAPDAEYAPGGWVVVLEQNGDARSRVLTDKSGAWRTEVPPGTYDLTIHGLVNHTSAHVEAFTLHAGEQSFAPIQTEATTVSITTGGTLAIQTTLRARISYRLRHPVRYLTYLKQNYL